MKHNRLFLLATLLLIFSAMPAKAQEVAPELAAPNIGNEQGMTYASSLWNGYYDKTFWEFVVGYVNKSWRCTYPDGIQQREDFFGDPQDKFIHGIQIGALFTPSFDWGLGLRTGLFLEGYVSRSRWITQFCNHFSEGDLYIPLQASYRIPFESDFGLDIFSGIGFQWAMQGRYYKQVGTSWPGGWWWRRPIPVYYSQTHQYGNGWPQKVNWQLDCGLKLRFQSFAFSFTYSFGLVDHGIENSFDDGKTYVTSIKSRQDKMQASIAFLL